MLINYKNYRCLCLVLILFLSNIVSVSALESICYGTTSNGKLEHSVQLPDSGKNYKSYSQAAALLGRTYVHSKVNEIIIAAYQFLEKEQTGKVYKYAETGFKEGGNFKPHKTHKNGLSVDFMVPVLDEDGKSVHLPTHAFNKWGYSIEFDTLGRFENLRIDYDALAAHIVALDKMAKARGVGIWRVIFDPKLQPYLLKTKYETYIKKNIKLSKKRSWVRHDEHYHVDFQIKCKKY